ncbi:DMT family transporter [Fervidibacillus halotolerans]|uniref:DMT family transporter n=1 Tax=Fervidibacillus halotolerans TaxID=2980027 RepID=A0A9E8LZW2_9BACI|nr:DMT family transporter [Fervidibacillus halotolerans]WAA11754.1 DMT family transporter [Fervidibacillus halotolerans]
MFHRHFHLKNNPYLLWGTIILITILWGYAWVLMKAGLDYMGPFAFSTFRFSTGTLTLFFLLSILKLGIPARKYWVHLAIVGMLQTTFVFLSVMYGLLFIGAGKASILLYSMPLWSSLLAVPFLKEEMSIKKILGLGLGMFGLVIIVGFDILFVRDGKAIFGELLILFGALSWAISNIYYRKTLLSLPKLQTSAFQMFFGTIGIFIAYMFTEWKEPIQWNGLSISYVLFTGIVASALCFTVWFVIISSVDMASATISTLLVPVFGLLFSSLLLGENITLETFIGSILIILGIVISQIEKKSKGPSKKMTCIN